MHAALPTWHLMIVGTGLLILFSVSLFLVVTSLAAWQGVRQRCCDDAKCILSRLNHQFDGLAFPSFGASHAVPLVHHVVTHIDRNIVRLHLLPEVGKLKEGARDRRS